MSVINQVIETIQEKLPGIQLIYFFGSANTIYENKESDLDIGILTPEKLNPIFRFELAEEVARKIQKDVDLVDLYDASTVLRFQIVSTGKLVFYTDKKFADYFEMLVYSMYIRFNDERREILESIKLRGRIY